GKRSTPGLLACDTADSLFVLKRLDFLGVKLVSVNQGEAETVNLVIHGLMGQLQREEGARKVRRGMAGVVREGRNPGGRPYGYRPVVGQVGHLEPFCAAARARRILRPHPNRAMNAKKAASPDTRD